MNLKPTIKHLRQKIVKQPAVLDILGALAYAYAWLAGKTGKFKMQGIEEFEKLIAEHDGGIFVAWHGRALLLPYFWRNPRPMKALVSPHNDGRIIARLLKGFHIASIDGSSDRHALSAALDIVRELEQGTVVALIPDGPRGPRMRLNKSVIYFAQKTGKPVMGFTYSSRGAKVLQKSWDAMLLPKLFAEGEMATTKPLFVPKEATEEKLEELRKNFEDELNALTIALDRKFGLPEILPADGIKIKRTDSNNKAGAATTDNNDKGA